MNERTVMKNEFTVINGNTPISDTGIFKWLSSQWYISTLPYSTKAAVVTYYLEAKCGFDVRKHCLDSDDLNSLLLCVSHWLDTTPYFPQQKAEDLFFRFISPQDRNFIKVEEVTPFLQELTRKAGWIYGDFIHNANTYYQIKGRKVYVKAQQILASRYLCSIAEVEAKAGES